MQNRYLFYHLPPKLSALVHPPQSRDEHGSGLDQTVSGLKPILVGSRLDWTAVLLKIGGSGLDRTKKFFVLIRFSRTYQKF